MHILGPAHFDQDPNNPETFAFKGARLDLAETAALVAGLKATITQAGLGDGETNSSVISAAEYSAVFSQPSDAAAARSPS